MFLQLSAFLTMKSYHKKLPKRRLDDLQKRTAYMTPPPHGRDEPTVGGSPLQGALPTPRLARPALAARIYPSGEFSVGRIPRDRVSEKEKQFDKGQQSYYQHEYVGRPHELEDGTVLHDTTDKIQLPHPILGSSCELSHTPKPYGLKGITDYGRRCIRNIAYLMEHQFGLRRMRMGTLTIPAMLPTQMEIICANWALLQKRFFERCKRRYEKLRKPWRYCAVTEIQSKRWKRLNQVGLHIHFLYPSWKLRGKEQYSLPHDWVRNVWRKLIENLLADYGGGGEFPVVVPTPNYKTVEVNANSAGYMAKYMTKGGDVLEEVKEQMGASYLPKQWWSADKKSKEMLRRNTYSSKGGIAEFLYVAGKRGFDDMFDYIAEMAIQLDDDFEAILGYGGHLSSHGCNVIAGMIVALTSPLTTLTYLAIIATSCDLGWKFSGCTLGSL